MWTDGAGDGDRQGMDRRWKWGAGAGKGGLGGKESEWDRGRERECGSLSVEVCSVADRGS